MTKRNARAIVAVVLSWACGCVPSGEEAVGASRGAVEMQNGMMLNGMMLNGMMLNGMMLNGAQLTGTLGSGQTVTAAELLGVTIERAAKLEDGRLIALRIDDVRPYVIDNEVLLYDISYRDDTDGSWQPLCHDPWGGIVPAIPVAGRWDQRQGVAGGGARIDDGSITLACTGYAIAKCVMAGYKPWKSVQVCDGASQTCRTVSLASHHQACTRMLRADYCGDGTPHTADGTILNVYDGVGIQADQFEWDVKTEWTPDGAACLNAQGFKNVDQIWGALPCRASLASAVTQRSCGVAPQAKFFRGTTLLMTEMWQESINTHCLDCRDAL